MTGSILVDQDASEAPYGLAPLAAALHALHLRAGQPSTRTIAVNASVSHDTVHRVLRCGQTGKVPRWESLSRIVQALGGDHDQFQYLWTCAVLEIKHQREASRAAAATADMETHVAGLPTRIPRSTWDPLTGLGRQRIYPRGLVIMHQGDPSSIVFIITSGYAKKVGFSPDGHEVLHGVLVPGQLCGHEAALASDRVCAFTFSAVSRVTGISLTTARFDDLISEFPELAVAVARDLANQIKEQALRIHRQSDPPITRIANVLLALANSVETLQADSGRTVELPIQLAQHEIGSLADVSRITAHRTLAQLRARGVVELGHRQLTITDLNALAELAYPTRPRLAR